MHTHTHTHEILVHINPATITRAETVEEDAVTIFLGWMAEDGFTYNVSITPQAPMMFSGTQVELRVSYNTSYNVTVLSTLCGQSSANTTFKIYYGESVIKFNITLSILLAVIDFYTVRCANPVSAAVREDPTVRVVTNQESDIFLEGAIATFTCPTGLALAGQNTSTCMENGEWEPNLGQVTCKGIKLGGL